MTDRATPPVALSSRGASAPVLGTPWWQTGRGIERLVLGVVLLAVLIAIVGMLATSFRVLPRLELAPSYRLIDQAGRPLQSNELRGSVALYSFTYAGCPSPCGGTLDPVRGVQDRLATVTDGTIPVRLITISVDPGDTPDALGRAATASGARPDVWRFAAPDRASAGMLLGAGFRSFSTRSEDGSYRLVPLYVLVDGAGIVRARYEVTAPTTDQLLRDVRAVVDEARRSIGVAHYFYEAVHVFECSPLPAS